MELASEPPPRTVASTIYPITGSTSWIGTTTKLRVVFDASSKCPKWAVAERTLLSGPKLQPDIVAVLLRFRAEPVALTADVKQMFRQIWMNPETPKTINVSSGVFGNRIPFLDYLLTTVIFGSTASPFLGDILPP
ncbi:uncharacterized protein [Temnothorax longispinosus]|uniref:uncharacterized protein n=1 Tax=Temnothorax longispinosus TaxID=300112 RepID=UPI003A9A3F17